MRKTKVITKDRAIPSFVIPRLDDRERIAQVWEMRLKGYTHERIAKEMLERFDASMLPNNYDGKAVRKDCMVALDEVQNELRESAIEMANIESQRFDKLLEAIWPAAESGDPRAIETALNISRERRKLFGLDNPEKLQIDWRIQLVQLLQSGQVTPEQIATEFGNEVLVEVNQKLLVDNG